MNQAEEFFFELKDWSTRKLKIIEDYISSSSNIFGSKYRTVYYIDGFAGKGVYDKGEDGNPVKGSPVLAAEVSQKFSHFNKPFTLKCINVEKDPDNYSNLVTETARFGELVENLPGTFEENIDKILSEIRGYPAVFFIDDFGIKGTGWDIVEKIVSRKEPTDIWIRFDYKTILRHAGFYESDSKDAHGKINTLHNLFGMTDDDDLRAYLFEASAEDKINNALALYTEHLQKTFVDHGKRAGFAAAYPIISIGGQRKYHLIFACAHLKAATLASNVVNGIEETFQHEKEEYKELLTGQTSFFTQEVSADQIFKDKVQRLKKAILLLPKNRPMSREELLYILISMDKSWFGKIGRRHLTQAIKELSVSPTKRIEIVEGTPGSDKAIFIILE